MQTIAQCLIWYLPPTMAFLYDQLRAIGPERAVILAVHALNPDRFPFDRIYILDRDSRRVQLSIRDRGLAVPLHWLWRSVIQAEDVAALHVHDGRLAPNFLPLSRRLQIPIVTTFIGRDISANLDGRYLAALRLLFNQGDLFTVLSHEMARQAMRLGCPEDRIRVIYRGIDLSRFPFTPRQAPKDGPVTILTAGRLVEKKGLDDLARAFVLLCRKHRDIWLRVIGEGPLRPRMEAILAEAGVGHCADFLGEVPRDRVATEMKQAHIFCLPSRVGPDGDSEGIPNSLKEAMATGLPVVSTYHAGIPELVEDGRSGYLVPERDVQALAERLASLLEKPAQWELMGRVGRAKVEADFSLGSSVRQLESQVYQSLLARR